MQQYLNILKNVYHNGKDSYNERTKTSTRRIIGVYAEYDQREGFPVITTKKFAFKPCIAEMIGFLRGYDSAEKFRSIGCNVWNANANDNEQWLNNPNRKGTDDLGRVYGVQARSWKHNSEEIDQLGIIVEKLRQNIDDRRLIVSHWNPGELSEMALPPCHVMYQFGIDDGYLHLSLYQRSCDLFLGCGFNVTGYSWLLYYISQLTGFKPGKLSHFIHDAHIYEGHLSVVEEQLTRTPFSSPTLSHTIELSVDSNFNSISNIILPEHFVLNNYNHHPALSAKMVV
jgi:thymidylate synthase